MPSVGDSGTAAPGALSSKSGQLSSELLVAELARTGAAPPSATDSFFPVVTRVGGFVFGLVRVFDAPPTWPATTALDALGALAGGALGTECAFLRARRGAGAAVLKASGGGRDC